MIIGLANFSQRKINLPTRVERVRSVGRKAQQLRTSRYDRSRGISLQLYMYIHPKVRIPQNILRPGNRTTLLANRRAMDGRLLGLKSICASSLVDFFRLFEGLFFLGDTGND